MGNVLEIITKESIHYSALPENISELIFQQKQDVKTDGTCDLYTCIKRQNNKFLVH